jgi:predicted DNA-binding transcriptional regulator YafY
VIDNDSELRVKLEIFITLDFIMELLSFGENVKVVKPDSLINNMKAVYRKALSQY